VIWDFETTSNQAEQQYFPLSLFPKIHSRDVIQGSWPRFQQDFTSDFFSKKVFNKLLISIIPSSVSVFCHLSSVKNM
jgi:hypothetical protein